jgi:integrase
LTEQERTLPDGPRYDERDERDNRQGGDVAVARPATGSASWDPKAKTWIARVTEIGGKRVPVAMDVSACLAVPSKPPRKCPCASCAQARRVAKIVSDKHRNEGLVQEGTSETANEWHARYLKVHGALGRHIEQHANDWRRFVADIIGTLPMTGITADHIKAIRDGLTKRRLAGKMSSKRTLNIWSNQIKAPLSRAFSDDDPVYGSLRVGPFASNPALGIKPPSSKADKEEDERERQALDPAETIALLSTESVPLAERRLYPVACYTGLRPAELYGLLWSDVRLDEQVPIIKVHRARHARTLEKKITKNRQSVRDLPIHPELRPLLRAMRDEARNAKGHVIPVVRAREIGSGASRLRAHLLAAGVRRDELQHRTAQLKTFDVRSLRTTFATWCSKAGYDSSLISRWLGHKPKGTAAKHYVKAAPSFEDVVLRPVQSGTVGPFPPLPASLLGSGGVLVREAKMNAKGPSKRRFAWVLNLDADLELARPARYIPTQRVRDAMASFVPTIARSLLASDDVLVEESSAPSAARGFTGRAFCPTTRALAILRRAGAELEPAPSMDVLRRVNSRAFASSLGTTLAGAAFVSSLEDARTKLEEVPPLGEAWRVKRAFGMAGRGQRIVFPKRATEADLAFVRAGMSEGGVQIEPSVAIANEYAIHGMLGNDGSCRLGSIVEQRCDARGAWLSSALLAAEADEEVEISERLVDEAKRVALALGSAGYFGPFGVDAYTYRDPMNAIQLQPRSEINARYTMGFAVGLKADRARS